MPYADDQDANSRENRTVDDDPGMSRGNTEEAAGQITDRSKQADEQPDKTQAAPKPAGRS